MQIFKKVTIDNIEPQYKTISVLIEDLIINDANEIIARASKVRRAFVPGEIDNFQQWFLDNNVSTGYQEALDIVNIMWTQEVIDAYNAMMAQQEE